MSTSRTGLFLITPFSDVHDKLIKASKTPVIGVIPSVFQGMIASAEFAIGAVSLVAFAIIDLSASRFFGYEGKNKLNSCVVVSGVHAFEGFVTLANSIANIVSVTYFNNSRPESGYFVPFF